MTTAAPVADTIHGDKTPGQAAGGSGAAYKTAASREEADMAERDRDVIARS